MITKALTERLFEAASIQRWNDHIRPVEFTELDKQAHKVVIAYVIAKYEEADRSVPVDWIKLIEGSLFEFFQRVVLTDIKPPVFHRMMARKGEELNRWVLRHLEEALRPVAGGFFERFERYLFDPDYSRTEKRILQAAHYLATNWEFRIIYNISPFMYGIDRTKEEIENRIEDFYDLIGVQKITLAKKSYGFIDLCGQLRFQKRWAQSPRVPATSVLGHMYIVAALAYFASLEVKACRRRAYNNFFTGLFHDLPEVLTRDIVSPVKKAVPQLEEIISEYERLQIEERVLPLLPSGWHEEMKFFVFNNFRSIITVDGEKKEVDSDEINSKYNSDQYNPVDGQIIEACDKLAAFIEACLSISHGITSRYLEEGKRDLYSRYKGLRVAGIDFGKLFREWMG